MAGLGLTGLPRPREGLAAEPNPARPALGAVFAASLTAGPARFLLADPLGHRTRRDGVVRLAVHRGTYWGTVTGATAAGVTLAVGVRRPMARMLLAMPIGAAIGTVAAGVERGAMRGRDGTTVLGLAVLGAAVGLTGVTGAQGLVPAVGGMLGGILAATPHSRLARDAAARELLAAPLVVGGTWIPSLAWPAIQSAAGAGRRRASDPAQVEPVPALANRRRERGRDPERRGRPVDEHGSNGGTPR